MLSSWLRDLNEEDSNFLKKFVLASGSLKELAGLYGVTYPTIRLRLDRLIEKIRILEEIRDQTPFERKLRLLYAEGKLDSETFANLLNAYRKEEKQKGSQPEGEKEDIP